MNRNEAIERALMKCNSLDMGDCVEIPLAQWEAVEEALAMPKDAERVTYTGVGTVSNVLYNGGVVVEWHTNQRTLCGKTLYIKSDDQKADAERVALLAEVEDWMKPPTFGEDTPAWATLNRIRAYLQGGA